MCSYSYSNQYFLWDNTINFVVNPLHILLYPAFRMASLLSLPFEVQLQIVRYSNLRDCLAFAQVSVASHDVVYYVLSHRAEVKFSSVIMDNEGYVSLTDTLFLQVLHAHTGVTCISNFCIPKAFAAFDDLSELLEFNLHF